MRFEEAFMIALAWPGRVAPTNFYEEVGSQNGFWGRSNLKAV